MVADAEQRSPVLTPQLRPTDFLARGRVVRRPLVQPHIVHLIPDRGQRSSWDPEGLDVVQLTANVRADLVVLGKFDLQRRPKLRAAYADARMTLTAQPSVASSGSGVSRVVRAHEVVGRHASRLIAPLLDHGVLDDGTPYLVEGWMSGQPIGDERTLAAAVPQILDGLAAVHRGYGISRVGLAEHWGEAFRERWLLTARSGVVPEDVVAWVQRLIDREGTLRRSFIHGDLVASNVLRSADGIALVDWEHAQEGILMNDAAKLHLFAAGPEVVLGAILSTFADEMPDVGSYSALEELALCHAQLVSRYPSRSARLVGHPRAASYERQVRRQVDRLALVRRSSGEQG